MITIRRYSYLIFWFLWLGTLDYVLIAGKTGIGWAWGILGSGSALMLYWLIVRPGKGSVTSEEELNAYFGKGRPVVVWLFSNY